MKWVILVALLGVAGWAGYEWLDDLMAREAFGSAVEAAIDDPRSTTADQIRSDIWAAAQRQGVTLDPSGIELQLTEATSEPIAGQVLTGRGLTATTQRLSVRVRYERRIWWQLRPVVIERARVYIASAAPPPGPQDRLLRQMP
jgi:hypothetical protein